MKALTVAVFVCFNAVVFAQQSAIQGFATFVPGRLFETGERTFSLHGELECMLNERVSVIGDGFYHLQNSHVASAKYEYNQNLLAGLAFHPYRKSGEFTLDTYVGIEPGISISKLNTVNTKVSTDPLVALLLGTRLQLTNHLYVFGQFRMIHGNHLGNEFHRLDEIRFSTGLGFTFWNKP